MPTSRNVAILNGNSKNPALSMNFLSGSDSRLTTGRSGSGATYFDQTGTLQLAAANTPRIDYGGNSTGRTNWVRNSTNTGAVIGNPGVAPNFWTITQAESGITTAIVGIGTDDSGNPSFDLQVSGTASAAISTANGLVTFESSSNIPALSGQTWTTSMNVTLVAGSMSGTLALDQAERNSVGSLTSTHLITIVPTSTMTQFVNTQVFNGGPTTAGTSPLFRWGCSNGQVVNFTLRISTVQTEQSASPTAFIPTYTAAATIGATPLGLLAEETRTNGIRNPRYEGAVAGSPGTAPTNTTFAGASGLTTSIVGTGVESGIPFVDIQVTGTATGVAFRWADEVSNVIVASPGQTWTRSAYMRLVSGTLTGVSLSIEARGYDSGVSGSDLLGNNVTPTSASLSSQRSSVTLTLADAAVTNIQPTYRVANTNGAVVSFTIRLGAPQCELGTFATSPILPAIGTPAATSRNADNHAMSAVGYFTDQNTTVAVSILNIEGFTGTPGVILFSDGTDTNRAVMRINGGVVAAAYVQAGSATAQPASGTGVSTGLPYRCLMRMGSSLSVSANSGAIVSQAGGFPIGINTITLGRNNTAGVLLNGYIKNFQVWKRLLSDGEMIAQSSVNL